MTTRVRFSRSADVFEAFPMLARFAAPPTDEVDPIEDIRRRLAGRRPVEAIALLAHTLPRREAVWWARRCVAALLGAKGEDECALATETWVRAPDDQNRREALERGLAAVEGRPTTWLALAAGRSGGNVAPANLPPTPATPEACAQAVSAAITLAIVTKEPREMPGWMDACVSGGVAFAEGQEMKIVAPAPTPARVSPRAS